MQRFMKAIAAIMLVAAIICVAGCKKTTFNVSVSANPTMGGSVTGGGTFQDGETCTVTATAQIDYVFSNWTENDNMVSTEANYTFSVRGNRILTANFTYNGGGGETPVDPDTPDIPETFSIEVSANPTDGGVVTGGGSFQEGRTCTVSATANTDYLFVNWTENDSVVSTEANYTFMVSCNHSLVANFNYLPAGVINGKFTINDNGDQVFFSQGNLQYIGSASTPYWKLAESQWECLGNNEQASPDPNADRDLFGWGTSGWDSGANCYQPWSTSTFYGDYYPGGSSMNDLTGSYANADWGVFNAISNGGNQTGQWRTLTGGESGEWDYIFNTRVASTVNGVANARYAKAKVADMQGVILFPDNYTHPSGVAQPVGINETESTGWYGNNYSVDDFASMQSVGAVFLPAAGKCYGITSADFVGYYGYYWSVLFGNYFSAYCVGFNPDYLGTDAGYDRNQRISVRLVRSCR